MLVNGSNNFCMISQHQYHPYQRHNPSLCSYRKTANMPIQSIASCHFVFLSLLSLGGSCSIDTERCNGRDGIEPGHSIIQSLKTSQKHECVGPRLTQLKVQLGKTVEDRTEDDSQRLHHTQGKLKIECAFKQWNKCNPRVVKVWKPTKFKIGLRLIYHAMHMMAEMWSGSSGCPHFRTMMSLDRFFWAHKVQISLTTNKPARNRFQFKYGFWTTVCKMVHTLQTDLTTE